MDNLFESPVTGQDAAATAAKPAVPDSGSATPGVATPTNRADEGLKVEEIQKKYERDIAQIKSTFDKKEAERLKEAQRKEEEWNRRLKEVELRGMDEEARKKYEAEHKEDEFRKLAQEKTQLQQQLEQQKMVLDYQKFFMDRGVPLSELSLDNGPEELARSGWEAIGNQTKKLQAELEALKAGKAPQQDKEIKEPPETLSHGDKTPSATSLTDAIKKYAAGDEERFWKGLESGSIPKSVLPAKKE